MHAPADVLPFPPPIEAAPRWTQRRRQAAVNRARLALGCATYDLGWHYALKTGRALAQLRSHGVPRQVALHIVTEQFEQYRRWSPRWLTGTS